MKIFVMGAGTMGSGIVQTFAAGGHDVVVMARKIESVEGAIKTIDKSLSKMVEKAKLEQAKKDEIMARISKSTSMEDAKDADLVVEAVTENMEIKKKLFSDLDAICKESAILSSNTSSLSITEIANATKRPDKVIGMHFFNPVPLMKLIEVIDGQLTSQETHDTIMKLSEEIGKTPVAVNEAPGFVVNRILVPMINEAIGILADGVATKEDIDNAMKLGANHPIGPLALADLIGNDVCLAIMEVLYSEFGDSKYRPHPLLRKMVRANLLGRKTSKGFYDYTK